MRTCFLLDKRENKHYRLLSSMCYCLALYFHLIVLERFKYPIAGHYHETGKTTAEPPHERCRHFCLIKSRLEQDLTYRYVAIIPMTVAQNKTTFKVKVPNNSPTEI